MSERLGSLAHFLAHSLPEDYEKDEKHKTVALNEQGTEKIEALLQEAGLLAQGDEVVPIPGTKRRLYLEDNAGAANVVRRHVQIDIGQECRANSGIVLFARGVDRRR